jgi:OHCU decarboxylase
MAIEPSEMSQSEFLETFGSIFEHSPWIAENVWYAGLEVRHDTAAGLHEAMCNQIRQADDETKLELLRAHPELAGKAADQGMTAASHGEQRRSGLDRCSAEELAEFQHLNDLYREKFGFPFIMAIKGYQARQILDIFHQRLNHSPAEELQTALTQVMKIGLFRLQAIFE